MPDVLRLPMWIDHEPAEARSGATFPVDDPATEEIVGEVPRGDAGDVDRAVQVARRAFATWRKVPGLEKGKYLHEIARQMREMAHELARVMTLEGGKPMIENLDEVDWSAAAFDYYAEVGRNSRGNSIPPGFEHQLNFTIKEPFGVVGAIIPFNYPLLLMAWKVSAALAAGNTVVIKPSHSTPLATLLLARAFEGLPRGVVGIVTGNGEALVTHPDVDMIAFTGSTQVGRRIMRLASDTLKRVNLETSGIDPFIICEDADLEIAAKGAVWARFLNSGQVCTSAKRFYVVEQVADEFVERFLAETRAIRVGNGLDPETDMGPVISARARTEILDQLQRSLDQGARLLHGGGRPAGLDRGYFLEPTVIDRVKHGDVPTVEEIFGPVAAIIRAKDVPEAIRLANDSLYGLGANIYTKSLQYALTAMEDIKAGTFWVNDPLSDNEAGPFGGARQSGIGRELGEDGLDAFREPKHVHIDWIQEVKSYWYPYARRPW